LLDRSHASLETRQAGGSAFEFWTREERDEKGLRVVREKGGAGAGRRILSFVSPQGGMFGTLPFFLTTLKTAQHSAAASLCSKIVRTADLAHTPLAVWLRVHFSEHPSFRRKATTDLLMELWTDLAEHNVLVAPGSMFDASEFPPAPPKPEELALTEDGDGFFRIAFSTATPEQMKQAADIIGRRVEKFFRV